MNRLVEHIHRDHGERDGVQAFAVHPVSCCCCCFILHLVVFVFLRDWIFFSDFSHNFFFSRAESSQKEQNGTTKRKMETFGPAVRTYPPPFLPSLPSAQQHYNKEKKTELTDDETLCGGFLTWLTSEKRPWLSGRYLSATWDVNELELKKDEIVNENKLVMRMVI